MKTMPKAADSGYRVPVTTCIPAINPSATLKP